MITIPDLDEKTMLSQIVADQQVVARKADMDRCILAKAATTPHCVFCVLFGCIVLATCYIYHHHKHLIGGL